MLSATPSTVWPLHIVAIFVGHDHDCAPHSTQRCRFHLLPYLVPGGAHCRPDGSVRSFEGLEFTDTVPGEEGQVTETRALADMGHREVDRVRPPSRPCLASTIRSTTCFFPSRPVGSYSGFCRHAPGWLFTDSPCVPVRSGVPQCPTARHTGHRPGDAVQNHPVSLLRLGMPLPFFTAFH